METLTAQEPTLGTVMRFAPAHGADHLSPPVPHELHHPDSVRWASDRYLVFQGPRTALIDADALKMSFPVARESGITSVEFSSDFKRGLNTKKNGQYLGAVELPENRKAAE